MFYLVKRSKYLTSLKPPTRSQAFEQSTSFNRIDWLAIGTQAKVGRWLAGAEVTVMSADAPTLQTVALMSEKAKRRRFGAPGTVASVAREMI